METREEMYFGVENFKSRMRRTLKDFMNCVFRFKAKEGHAKFTKKKRLVEVWNVFFYFHTLPFDKSAALCLGMLFAHHHMSWWTRSKSWNFHHRGVKSLTFKKKLCSLKEGAYLFGLSWLMMMLPSLNAGAEWLLHPHFPRKTCSARCQVG